MNELIKIRDISTKYDISARTLRYYEDMGLMTSTRSDDYAYRLYDNAAVHRLEQIETAFSIPHTLCDYMAIQLPFSG